MLVKTIKTIFLICVFLLLFFVKTYTQTFPIQRFSVQQGIAHSNVFSVFQDKKGFLWFSTAYGLSRFDGKNFKNFTSENGLNNNTVISLMQMPNDNIWINNFGGVNMIRNDSIFSWSLDKKFNSTNCYFTINDEKNIWLINLKGGPELLEVNKNTIKSIVLKDDNNKNINFTKAIKAPGLGLLFCSEIGLYYYNEKDGFKRFLKNIIHEKVYDITIDKNNNYWLGLQNRIVEISNGEIVYTYNLPKNLFGANMLADSYNNIWVAVPQIGIVLIKDHKAEDITEKLNIGRIIINYIFEDHEKNIWIATHGNGVYRLNTIDILNYRVDRNNLNVYANTIIKDNDNMLVGTYGTVSRIANKKLSSLTSSKLNSIDCIYFLKKINEEKIIIGIPRGLIIKSLKNPLDETYLAGPGAISICVDHVGKIWLGGFNLLSTFENNKQIKFDKFKSVIDKRINYIFEDHYRNLWIGTNSGIYVINEKRDSCTEPINSKINNWNINQIFEDSKQNIWLATETGLACKNKSGWQLFTKSNGLIDNKCNAISENATGTILVGTLKGLSKVDNTNFTITELRIGVLPTEILSMAHNTNNQLFIGTVNGVSIVDYNEKEIVNTAPEIYINYVLVDSFKYFYPSSITAPYKSKKIKIEFIGLNYRSPEGVEYRYSFDPENPKWNITSNNSIELPSLSEGNYEFMVEARVNKAAWGKPAKLLIVIPTPYWKTWWFIFLEICLIISMIYTLLWWRFKIKNEKEKHELMVLNKINYFKQQAFHALINPHFIFNCMNSIQFYIHKNNNKLAYKYLEQFGNLIRMTMEHAQESFIDLKSELERLEIYLSLEKLRCGEILSYSLTIDPALNIHDIMIPNMVIQPYVENAIWHGIMPKSKAGIVEIIITKLDATYFKISI
ncbi:MAG TPA: two-component regulator propeller domain-containing protein, partial [Saprospiraceae bacterium]|nr:two-component regulator propeller domain-containing protein [Saprospiraceae bacterium]